LVSKIYDLEFRNCGMFNSKPTIMKLLMLLPNLVLIAVSGVNLSNELSGSTLNNNLAIIVLHLSVLVLCLVFVALIVKSMFSIKYIEITQTQTEGNPAYTEFDLHSA